LMQITTDSAQCYPGYVARGEVRASKDAISEIAGIACMFRTQAETASHDTCQTLEKCLQHANPSHAREIATHEHALCTGARRRSHSSRSRKPHPPHTLCDKHEHNRTFAWLSAITTVHLRAWVSSPGEDSGCRGFQRDRHRGHVALPACNAISQS